jgi:hypothetical protein
MRGSFTESRPDGDVDDKVDIGILNNILGEHLNPFCF